jgi:hypothetical protein
MRLSARKLRTSFLIVFSAAGAYGQTADTGTTHLPRWLGITGQIRGRVEVPGGSDFTTNSFEPYLLTRLRLGISIKPARWLRFYGEVQDTRALGYDGQPPANLQNPLDLRQGYVELNSGGSRGVSVRAGRQEMAIGSSRLLSIGPWSNTSKSFDAVRMAAYFPGVRFEWIAGSLVQTDGTRFDRHKPGEHFYASYNTFSRLVRRGSIEPYFIVKTTVNTTGEIGPRGDAVVYTGGLRWLGTLPGRFDYSAEMIRQWGSWGADRVSAEGGTYTLGWRISEYGWKPRLSSDYSFGSGDRNPKDGVRGGLDTIYGANQPFFSYTGMVSWKNIKTVRAGADFAPAKELKLLLDYRDYWLYTVQDAFYSASNTQIVLNRKATSDHLGHGPDVQASRAFGRWGQATIGIAAIISGEYLKQSGRRSGYLYPYVMWMKQF